MLLPEGRTGALAEAPSCFLLLLGGGSSGAMSSSAGAKRPGAFGGFSVPGRYVRASHPLGSSCVVPSSRRPDVSVESLLPFMLCSPAEAVRI